MIRLNTIIFFLILTLSVGAQELTVKSFNPAPFDLAAASKPVIDYNGVACGLVKVRLASEGAEFEGNVMQPVEFKAGEYWVYMTKGSYKLKIKHPKFIPLDISFRDYGVHGVESNCTYELTLLMPQTGVTNVDDGMRYLVIKVSPQNATVLIDGKLQTVHDGSASALLAKGTHSYSVEAPGYYGKNGTVELSDGRKTIEVNLESALAQVSVNCPTAGAQIYVNEILKGSSPWNGQLSEGNYQIEARLDGYRPQRQSITLVEREHKTINLPALTAITGNLNVNYLPTDAEVWLDGKRVGVSPDIFRNILVGRHAVEIRASGYQSVKKNISISEGQTEQLSGELIAFSQPSPDELSPQSSPDVASPNRTMSVPDAVDLGLSVKWASFNLGASKPEEAGNYYFWGVTEPAGIHSSDAWMYGSDRSSESLGDAATVNLGGSWRMPTEEECKELVKKCKRKWTRFNGVNGQLVTGPNGNKIFLPAVGYRDSYSGSIYDDGERGNYWSATSDGVMSAYCIVLGNTGWGLSYSGTNSEAFPIRPVLPK